MRRWNLFAIVLLLSACAGPRIPTVPPPAIEAKSDKKVISEEKPMPPKTEAKPVAPDEYRQVIFPEKATFNLSQISDFTDPVALVNFALALVERKELVKAAAFFMDSANSEESESKGNEFRASAIGAAATLYLLRGRLTDFKEAVARLRKEIDRFQGAAPEPRIAILFAIDSKLQGEKEVDTNQLPWAIQQLFKE